jgi:putative pyruvate formate lyase activating enzyme
MDPRYLQLSKDQLRERIDAAIEILGSCTICPRLCEVDRTAQEKGFCGTGRSVPVASYNLHFGEEAPLVGNRGSGTIFFGGCNLGCVFCQNYDISRYPGEMPQTGPQELAGVMLWLQEQGAHNINFVTPSHVVPQILEALPVAIRNGLRLPLVYNSGGYDRVQTLRLLDGVVDIYMPDAKFSDPGVAETYCGAGDYPEVAMSAIREMHRQVGDLETDGNGVAVRGLIVRHLLLPGDLAGTRAWLEFLARDISPRTYLNIMDQYRPSGEARFHPELRPAVTRLEYESALREAARFGLERLDSRERRGPKALWRMLYPEE